MVRCHLCHGKGKFKAYKIVVNNKTVEVPEQKCITCDGKGIIAAPQFEGSPPVYGHKRS